MPSDNSTVETEELDRVARGRSESLAESGDGSFEESDDESSDRSLSDVDWNDGSNGRASQNSSVFVGENWVDSGDDDDDDTGTDNDDVDVAEWVPLSVIEFNEALQTQNLDFCESSVDKGDDLSDLCGLFEFGDEIEESSNPYIQALEAKSGLRILKPGQVRNGVTGKYKNKPELGLFKLFFLEKGNWETLQVDQFRPAS